MSDFAAQRLIFAICMQACHDYAHFSRKLERYPRDTETQRELNDAVRFFKSDWWDSLMPNINGKQVMKEIDRILQKGENLDHVCEQQLRKGVENIPYKGKRAEIYHDSDVYEQEEQGRFIYN